jgi:hypothetical protein
MPPPRTIPQLRLDNIITGLTAAANTLGILCDLNAPFLEVISDTVQSLLKCAEVSASMSCYITITLSHRRL